VFRNLKEGVTVYEAGEISNPNKGNAVIYEFGYEHAVTWFRS